LIGSKRDGKELRNAKPVIVDFFVALRVKAIGYY
jgi:hypothetical protein